MSASGEQVFNPVRMGDVFDGVANARAQEFRIQGPAEDCPFKAERQRGRPDHR